MRAAIQEDEWNNSYHILVTHGGKYDLTIFSLNIQTYSAMQAFGPLAGEKTEVQRD